MLRLAMKTAGVDLKMDIARMWGTMMKAQGTPGYLLGMMVHFVVSAALALPYAWGFKNIFQAKTHLWLWGLLGGVIHWLIAGLFLGIVPAMHPEIPEKRPAPGPFAKNFGAPDVPAFLLGHLVYGLFVGSLFACLGAMRNGRRSVGR